MHLDAPLPHRRAHNPLQMVEGETSRDVLDFVNAGLVQVSAEGTAQPGQFRDAVVRLGQVAGAMRVVRAVVRGEAMVAGGDGGCRDSRSQFFVIFARFPPSPKT